MPSDKQAPSGAGISGGRLLGHWLYMGIGLGVLFWLFSAFLHTFVFHHGHSVSFVSEIFNRSPHELFVRGFVLFFFSGFGLYAQVMTSRQKTAIQLAHKNQTLLKNANEQIHLEKQFSDTLINALPGVFYLFDKNLRFQRWNQNFRDVTGYSDAELAQLSPLDLFDADEAPMVAERIGRVFSEGVSSVEANFLAKDGTKTPHYFTGYGIRIESNDYLIGVGIDISDRKKMETEREQMIHELGERVKEQRCMYRISDAVQTSRSIDELFRKTIHAIRDGWQYEKVTRARIVFDETVYILEPFEPTEDRIAFDILLDEEKRGEIEVYYIEERPRHDVGPFLDEEIALLKGIATTISEAIKKYLFERELRARQDIAESFLNPEEEDSFSEALNALLRATNSKYGMFGYVAEDGAMVYPSITRGVWEKCATEYKDVRFPRDRWGGIWGRSLLEQRTLISNSALPVPQGHIPITNTVTTPIVFQDEIVGHLQVSDKAGNYDRNDQDILESLSGYIAPILSAWRKQKFSEVALRESEARFRRIAENAKDMIYRMTLPDGVYEYVSPAAQQIFGYPPDVFYQTPKKIQEAIHPNWREYFEREWEKLLRGEMSPFYEYQIMGPKGDIRWLNQRNVLILDGEGNPAAIEGIVTDITKQKEAERLLSEEREQLRTLFDSTDDVIYVADPDDYTLLYANKVVREIWGEDCVGKRCHMVLQDLETPCDFCTNDRIFGPNLGKTYVWEFQNEITQHWYRCSDKAIRWLDGRWVRFEIAADITEEKLFRQEQVRLDKFSALGQVAAGVAHELNNPLMGVLNYAQYCLSETEESDDRYEVLQDIEKETKRCVRIVENLLSASRQDDAIVGKIVTFDPADVIRNVLKLLEYRTSKEEVQIFTEVAADLPPLIMSRDAFQQLFMNVFTNAIDSLESRDMKQVHIQVERQSGNVIIKIIDTGCGIPAEIREKIFDPFFTTKPPGKGTGLGLATCWKVVQSQGGHMECRSRAGSGTEMVITLPTQRNVGDYH